MTLAAGAKLGPYEVIAPLGAGGMGEVYRARDTRLGREVAVKVLPSHLSDNAELKQRFEREAKAISALSHPHICALYDVGNEAGVEYLVMEYLEGETLADRLTKGPLPADQTLRFGIEIADALDRAHKQGIVHRDLKPGNVMLTKSGVKLLDFGLAKHRALGVDSQISQLSSLPTEATPANLTERGTIMGTFQYMAPEQLEGKDADARSDIFAFGCVLYEMASGRKAFSGKSRASMIAAILERDPAPISSIVPMTPPALDRVVKTCLAKEPDDRFQTAHDVKLQLEWIVEGGSQAGAPAIVVSRRRSRERWAWIAAGILGIAALALGALVWRAAGRPAEIIQTSILPPEKSSFDFSSGAMALSPDGRRIAFVAPDPSGKSVLWVRALSGLSAQPLAGTDGAKYPFWSPDSARIGFFVGAKLKKIDASGGPAETVCDALDGRGGSWNRDGTIVFAPNFNTGLSKVAAAGGTSVPITKLDASRKENTHRWPWFLPDGRHFLYADRTTGSGTEPERTSVWVGGLDGKTVELLHDVEAQAQYASGHLLFVREGTLLAQRFSPGSRKLAGDAFPVAEHLQNLSGYSLSMFSASQAGALVYMGGGSLGLSQLAWLDRSGRQIETIGNPGMIARPKLSHDEKRVAMDVRDPSSANVDVWVFDIARRTQTRLTFAPGFDGYPIWSPDDSRVIFSSDRKNPGDLYEKSSAGTGEERPVLASDALKAPFSWTADGSRIGFQTFSTKAAAQSGDLWTFSFADQKAAPYLQTDFNEGEPVFSPDGKWIAYVSNESGKNEIYVRTFPDTGGKWQISTSGGEDPLWSRDGSEIFYDLGTKLMSVPVKTAPAFEAGTPQLLFEARFRPDNGVQYDVARDGKRFLVDQDVTQSAEAPVTLVQNWLAKKR
ncbi:MAG TPA: protein kinase [Thermoanaerobaculia bacterium]|jgi:Tol biopolymer transport system component/predicted Ser/Thr protein kinase|nr:protein kinase [Thermoanaerobaculia bacterium]